MTLTRSRLIEAIACAVYQEEKGGPEKPWHRLHPLERAVYIDAVHVALRTGDMNPMTSELANILGFARPDQAEVSG